MRNGKKIILLFLFLPFKLLSQDITGLWQGTLYNDTTKQFYRYEIGISQDKKGKFSGFSHTWFLLEDQQYYGVKKIKIRKASDGKIIVEDDGLIANNYPVSPAKHVRQLNVLSFSTTDNEMILSGPFSTNRTKEYSSLTGSVEVKRKIDFRQSALVPHLQELGLDEQLSFVKADNDMMAAANQKKITEQETAKKDEVAAIALAAKENEKQASTKVLVKNIPAQASENKAVVSTEKTVAKENKKEETIAKVEAIEKTNSSAQVVIAATLKEEKQGETDSILAVKKQRKETEMQDASIAASKATKQKIETQRIADSIVIAQKQQEAEKKKLIEKLTGKMKTNAEEIAKVNVPSPTAAQKTDGVKKDSISIVAKKIVSPAPITAVNNISIPKTNTAAADVENRKTVLQQTVTFKTDSLQLALYDNGEVDGDTVSILMNGVLIMARQGLSTNAIRKTIYIDPNADSVQLVMYAENLGTIAPNTGLLVVRDGKDLYEIRFSGDLQKNASIVFRRKKE